jgi:protein phosphatase
MELWGITDCGKKRKHNEDVFRILNDEENDVAVIVVCDGIGGARAGNVASSLAADVFVKEISNFLETSSDPSEIANKMIEAVYIANKSVYLKSKESVDFYGMGTTLTAVVSTTEGEVVVNVGDSRAYHITESAIRQITRDHTIVEEMVSRGDLTRSEARRHPKKNLITRALGTSSEEIPDIFLLNLKSGEYILLCTDGLSDIVTDNEFYQIMIQKLGVKKSCEVFVDLALDRGAPDNVTAVLFRKS